MQLLDLLLPPSCAGCRRRGSLLCPACRHATRPAGSQADRFVLPDASVVVGDALRLAVAACAHDGPLRSALAALKYTGARRLAPVLADLTFPALQRVLAISGPAVLVPVPIHAERRAARGYNQAELLAVELGRRLELPLARSLERSHATVKQHRLNRGARLANLRGAFVAAGRMPRVAIVVDDIITTSATLEACAATLVAAGCQEVYGVAVAREV
jgi:ComF family protein